MIEDKIKEILDYDADHELLISYEDDTWYCFLQYKYSLNDWLVTSEGSTLKEALDNMKAELLK